jgi:hypothetical protein
LDAVPRQPAFWGILPQAVVVGGQVAATWKTATKADGLLVDVSPHRRLTKSERQALDKAAARYARFAEVPVACTVGRAPRTST